MKMVRIFIFICIALIVANDAQAQVPQKIIVEHFTNTRCGICSFRNPPFYNVYNNNPGILHISYHPSSPYASCYLHQHNKAGNDDRTRYYNVYGGTPKFVIQGQRNNNYAQADVYDTYKNKQSDVSITLTQFLDEEGMINVNVTVKNETGANLSDASLFIGIAEAVVKYAAPNGENEHLDVFRKAFTPAAGEIVNLNESINLSYKIEVNDEWVLDQLFVYAILQETDSKAVIQAEAAAAGIEETFVGINNYHTVTNAFYPNPAANYIYSEVDFGAIEIYNNKGQLVLTNNSAKNNKLNISLLEKGIYFIKATANNNTSIIEKLLKQ